jgi:protein-S-isoprenylcysteine O-methyltransferase Ste14
MGKAVLGSAIVLMALIRAPHIRRSTHMKVKTSRRDVRDNVLVAFVSVGLLLPLLWIATSALRFADDPGDLIRFIAGALFIAVGLLFLHLSHIDLGTNWSNTLEVREHHELVTRGIYRRIRHPMYAALLAYGLGQTLIVANWIVGPSFLIPFAVLVALRMSSEERMMLDEFGTSYEAYVRKTERLLPGVW